MELSTQYENSFNNIQWFYDSFLFILLKNKKNW